jgi:hypothetical protein
MASSKKQSRYVRKRMERIRKRKRESKQEEMRRKGCKQREEKKERRKSQEQAAAMEGRIRQGKAVEREENKSAQRNGPTPRISGAAT